MKYIYSYALLLSLALGAVACGDDDSSRDTSVVDTDTGVVDTDTGVVDTDTGVVDTDTGVVDTDMATGGDAFPTTTLGFEGGSCDPFPEGITFAGAGECASIGVGSCYDSGAFSYRVAANTTISFDQDVNSVDVFFVGQNGGAGSMLFLDADGNEVSRIDIVDQCGTGPTPPTIAATFTTPVRSISFDITGTVWVDGLTVNPAS